MPRAALVAPVGADVWRRYGAFLRRPPLLTVEWQDDRTEARGWLVVNRLRGGGGRGRDAHARRGVGVIACGANPSFREASLGSTRVQRLADGRFTVIPDVVANCGMARAFSFLMERPAHDDPAAVFRAVDATIAHALDEISERGGRRPTGLLAATLGHALDRIDAVRSGSHHDGHA